MLDLGIYAVKADYRAVLEQMKSNSRKALHMPQWVLAPLSALQYSSDNAAHILAQ
jgi:hypothetical protein